MMEDGVHYDEAHRRHMVDGRPIPSVTQILRAAGLAADFSRVNPDDLERGGLRGRAVHEATHYDDEGTLDEASIDPVVLPYLEAWRRFKQEHDYHPVAIERVVVNWTHWYIGRVDRLVTLDGLSGVLDIKTGDDSDAHWQTAAYANAAGVYAAGFPLARWSVRLSSRGTYALTRYPLKGRSTAADLNDFLAAARIINLRQQRHGTPNGDPIWMI